MGPIRGASISLAAAGLVVIAAPAVAATLASYGIRTGVTTSGIHPSWNAHPIDGEPIGSGSRSSVTAALFARISLGRTLSLQPEIGWVSKGDEGYSEIEPTPPQASNTHVEVRIDYLEIPVLMRLDVPAGFLSPYLLAGSAVAFRMGSSQETSMWMWGDSFLLEVTTVENPRFQDVDWSLIGGGGLTLGRGHMRLVVESRYALGMVSIYPKGQQADAYNEAWITTLGIELR